MAVTQYIGARYVPLFSDPLDWDSTKAYEPLTIVYYLGNSYTSRQSVPTGIDIANTDYWAITGNYNAQIEAYRKEVTAYDGRITANAQAIADEVTRAIAEESAIKALIDAEKDRAEAAEKVITTDYETAINTEKTRASNAESELAAGVANAINAVTAENERAEKAESELTKKLDLQAIPNHLPGAKFVMREEVDMVNYSAQGFCVFPPENPQYVAMAIQNRNDDSGYISIIDYSTKAAVAKVSGSIGHGSTIAYSENKLYITAFNESNVMYVLDVSNPKAPLFGASINTGNYIPWGVFEPGKLLVSSAWSESMTLYSYDIETSEIVKVGVTPNAETDAQMQCVGYDQISELFSCVYSSMTSKVVFFNADNSFVKDMTFEPFYMFAEAKEIEQVQTCGTKIWFSNNPEGWNDKPFRHVANVWEADLLNPSEHAITPYQGSSNVLFTMDDSTSAYTTIDDINHAISGTDYQLKLKYSTDISGVVQTMQTLMHLAQQKDYTADVIFADLDGGTLWVDFNNYIGAGFLINNGTALIRTTGTWMNDADKLKMTQGARKVFCNATLANIRVSNVPNNTNIWCVYGVGCEVHVRTDVASTFKNFIGGSDICVTADYLLSN